MKIYSRFDGSKVVFENEMGTLRETVVAAVSSGADLSGADLGDADLRGANLRGADLGDADLGGANLGDADLGDADLRGANLRGADLGGANLGDANLGDANLGDANLRGADLGGIKSDIFDVLLRAPNEISALVEALKTGRVNGSVYKDDSGCGCLVGTLAIAAHKSEDELEFLKPNGSRPAERWFLAIRKGDTPEKSTVVKLTLEWVEEFEMLLTRAVTLRTAVPVSGVVA